MHHDALADFERIHLERLKLAADVILADAPDLPDSFEEELILFKDRVERALLLPDKPKPSVGTAQ